MIHFLQHNSQCVQTWQKQKRRRGLWFKFLKIFRVNCQIKVYLLKSILGNVNDYFWEHTIYHPKPFDTYSNYEKRLLIAGFKREISEPRTLFFVYEHELYTLVKEKTCFKSVPNPSSTCLRCSGALRDLVPFVLPATFVGNMCSPWVLFTFFKLCKWY